MVQGVNYGGYMMKSSVAQRLGLFALIKINIVPTWLQDLELW